MGRKPTHNDAEAFIEYLRDARDEMNLLEHSISSASTQVDRKTRSIVFSKPDVDPETREPIDRTWEVKFRDGRPTAIDDDVFVALLKLSADSGFKAKRVFFTRLQICRILGWADNGGNYKKIDDALTRLRGVSIDAKNYWYDNRLKCWRDRDFNLFDFKDVLSRSTYQRALKAGGKEAAKSWIDWSETMMDSFGAGYVRKMDLNEYLAIENPVARKLYRFLGKQFWHRTSYAIDLPTLMHEKLGYDGGERRLWRLRQKLAPVIEELEARNFYGLSHAFNASYGSCEVVFSAAATTKDQARKGEKKQSGDPLLQRLLKFGVDRTTAADSLRRLSTERVVADLEHVEHEAKAGRVKSSKAGMLATMLKSEEPWPRPEGFISTAEREKRRQALDERKTQTERAEAQKAARDKEDTERELAAFNTYMATLSEVEHEEIKDEATRAGFWGKRYRDALKDGNPSRIASTLNDALFAAWRSKIKTAFGQGEEARLGERSIG